MSIPSHFARTKSSRSQCFSNANHLLCGFLQLFAEGLLQKPPSSAISFTAIQVWHLSSSVVAIQHISKSKLSDCQWLQTSLPLRELDVWIRCVSTLAIPAFVASAHLLPKPTSLKHVPNQTVTVCSHTFPHGRQDSALSQTVYQ